MTTLGRICLLPCGAFVGGLGFRAGLGGLGFYGFCGVQGLGGLGFKGLWVLDFKRGSGLRAGGLGGVVFESEECRGFCGGSRPRIPER